MCEKYGNGWKNSRILQLNFYFMPCYSELGGGRGGVRKNVRFRICQPSQLVHVCYQERHHVKCVLRWVLNTAKSIFNVCYRFSPAKTSLHSPKKWIIFPYIEWKSIWKMPFSSLHRTHNIHIFLLLFWLLFACQCVDVCSSMNLFNGFWTALLVIPLWYRMCSGLFFSDDGTEHPFSGWRKITFGYVFRLFRIFPMSIKFEIHM